MKDKIAMDTRGKKAGMNIDKYKVVKFINMLLLITLFYTYLQLALLQKEYTMFKQYNHASSSASVTNVPNLPRISDLK